MDIHGKALDSMFDDMDDMETKKMFGETGDSGNMGGVSVTISVTPNGEVQAPEMMNKGGMAGEKCYSEGGIVAPEPMEKEDLTVPPFLRKKKRSLGV